MSRRFRVVSEHVEFRREGGFLVVLARLGLELVRVL